MAQIGTDIAYATSLLQTGQLVGVPTDTVYGLAGSALDINAINELYQVKGRAQNKALIAQVDTIDKMRILVKKFPNNARILAEKYWPGALTIIMDAKDTVPNQMLAGQPTIGIRIPNHRLMLDLLSKLDFPLAVTSANKHGHPSLLSAIDVNEQLGNEIEYILDGGVCTHAIESTIVGFDESGLKIIREGAISAHEIKQTLNLE